MLDPRGESVNCHIVFPERKQSSENSQEKISHPVSRLKGNLTLE